MTLRDILKRQRNYGLCRCSDGTYALVHRTEDDRRVGYPGDAIVPERYAYPQDAQEALLTLMEQELAPTNGLSPAELERLIMLAEEASEVIQGVAKIVRHGYESTHPAGGPTNREHLRKEALDFAAVYSRMGFEKDVRLHDVLEIGETWRRKTTYTHHQGD